MGDQLPPFGIRQLRNREPYSILQITESQYQTNVDACSDAILSYIDDDDGEKVTVGSSLELKERLEETPPSNAPYVNCYNTAKRQYEDRYIHLFDLQNTTASRSMWRTQRRQYKDTKKQDQRTFSQKLEDDSVSSIDLNAGSQVMVDGQKADHGLHTTRRVEPQQALQPTIVVALSDAVPDLVDNLATILQTTSEILRKAAQKSRQSKTTPIEDVLRGVSSIVDEIGNFGLSLLDSVHDKSETPEMTPECLSGDDLIHSQHSKPISVKKGGATEAGVAPSPISDISVTAGSTSLQQGIIEESLSDVKQPPCAFCSTFKLQCRETQGTDGICHNCATVGQSCSLTPLSAEAPSNVPTNQNHLPDLPQVLQANPGLPRYNSILDQDTEDADFSRRYPPLMSLRRANTIAGLYDQFAGPREQVSSDQGLVRHGSWVKRYPHRPVPYVLDAETQRRRDYARNCYPAQKYTPGPGIRDMNVHPVLKPKTASTTQPTISVPEYRLFAPKVPEAARLDEADSSGRPHSAKSLGNVKTGNPPVELINNTNSSFRNARISLPGAWPESDGRVPADASLGESSGAFFNRMMRDNPSRRQGHKLDTNERLTRHRSFSRQKSNNNPFNELNRSHTISSTATPASRLNRPFEPLYPVAAPSNTLRPHLETNKVGDRTESISEDTSNQPAKVAEIPPWTQRRFEPVWEEHFDKIKQSSDKDSKLDQKKDFDSMYSPPPRHMRSVPDLATMSKAVTFSIPSKPVAVPSVPARVKPFNLPHALTPPVVNPVSDTSQQLAAASEPAKPYQVMFPREIRPLPNARRLVTVGDLVNETATRRDPDTKVNDLGTKLTQCLSALRDMGYGIDDDNLASRLHIYATAAGGDVMEAVDMIEEDKKAHLGQAAEQQLRRGMHRQSFFM